jgi:hypothetical protein
VIFLLRKKKGESLYGKYKNEFTNYMSSQSKQLEYKEYSRLYKEIRKYYMEKINCGEIEIAVERIQLEDDLGKYNVEMPVFAANYMITLVCALLPVYLQVAGIFEPNTNRLLTGIIVIGLIAYAARCMAKIVDKDKPKYIILNICLRVIEDIEIEMKEETQKRLVEDKTIYKSEDKSNINLFNDIVIPSLVEVAAISIFKRDGLLRRIFRKK